MPLKKGKKNIGWNIKEMTKSGHPRNQAIYDKDLFVRAAKYVELHGLGE